MSDNKNWIRIAAKDLLDDQNQTSVFDTPAWQKFIQRKLYSQPLATKAPSKVNQSNERTIFKSTPTLKEMMAKYNGPSTKVSPIKNVLAPSNNEAFRFTQTEHIELPSIPGRVLRPEKK